MLLTYVYLLSDSGKELMETKQIIIGIVTRIDLLDYITHVKSPSGANSGAH